MSRSQRLERILMFLTAEFGTENITQTTPLVAVGDTANRSLDGVFPSFWIKSERGEAVVRFDIMEIECTDEKLKQMVQNVFKRATGATRPLIRGGKVI